MVISIRDVKNALGAIERQTGGIIELSVRSDSIVRSARPAARERRDRSIRCDLSDTMQRYLRDVDVSGGIDGDTVEAIQGRKCRAYTARGHFQDATGRILGVGHR